MKLYGYWRSSASYRLRIALNIKGLAYDHEAVHLVKDGGQQLSSAYRALNPNARVPTLVLDDGEALTQSMAILDYLEEAYPEPSFLPGDPIARAHCRAFAQLIACDIQPLANLSVLRYVKETLGADKACADAWAAHWTTRGLAALEELAVRAAAKTSGKGAFLFGDGPTLAEITLVPQLYNARRIALDLEAYPRLLAADEAARGLAPFAAAAPESQLDAT